MVLPTGSLVNAAAIIAGSLVGMALHGRFPERFRTIVFQGLGLCVLLIGAKMALTVTNPLLLIFSLLLGGLLIMGIGLTLLDIKRVNLSNLLPSLVLAVALALLFG